MSDAIEGADVMLYGVSLRYKESANVRAHHMTFNGSSGCADIGHSAAASACADRLLTCLQCRMDANYAHQQELDMIPLMMQKDYSPKGWLGLILGTRMWYAVSMSSTLSFHCCDSPLLFPDRDILTLALYL